MYPSKNRNWAQFSPSSQEYMARVVKGELAAVTLTGREVE